MEFGTALKWCKEGYKIKRDKWKTDEFIVYQKGYPDGINCNKQTAKAWGLNEGDLFKCEPYLQIQKNGSHYMWTPNIEDCLAEDWVVEM